MGWQKTKSKSGGFGWASILGVLVGIAVLFIVVFYSPFQGYTTLAGYQIDFLLIVVMIGAFILLLAGWDMDNGFLKALGVTVLVGGFILIIVYPLVLDWWSGLVRKLQWYMLASYLLGGL